MSKNNHNLVKYLYFKKHKIAFLAVTLGIIDVKNELPRPKTVVYRPQTQTHSDFPSEHLKFLQLSQSL